MKKINLSSNSIGTINPFNPETIPKNDQIKNKGTLSLIYRLNVIYNFIKMNISLRELNITKNPFSEKLSIVSSKKDLELLIKKNANGEIIINDFYSFLVKIKRELLNEEGRNNFVLKFDIGKVLNLNSFTFNYENEYIKDSY